jgi:hypothetical protein
VVRLVGRHSVEEIILQRSYAKLDLTSTVIEGGQVGCVIVSLHDHTRERDEGEIPPLLFQSVVKKIPGAHLVELFTCDILLLSSPHPVWKRREEGPCWLGMPPS